MSDISQRIAALSPEKRALLLQRLQKQKDKNELTQSIQRQPRSRDSFPTSFSQQRLWFLDRLEPNSSFYNLPYAIRLTGVLNLSALEQSLNEIVRRHEVLRTTFVEANGEPRQAIAPAQPLSLPTVDLRQIPASERESEALRLATREAQTPFNLTTGPLLRSQLLQLDDREYIVLFTLHHIVSDGWSTGVIVRELAALYDAFSAGKPSPLPELPIQYVDFAVWQRDRLQSEVLESQLSYWKQHLQNAPAALDLPSDRPRIAVQTYQGETETIRLPKSLTEALKAFSKAEGVTLFMTLLAAFKTLLYRYSAQENIVVGTPIANRTRAEIEGAIGFFVNSLALHTDLSGNPTVRELLHRVRDVSLGAYAHQDLPFEKLVEELHPDRDLNRSPIFQVMFVLQNAPSSTLELTGLTLQTLAIERGTTQFDLSLSVTEYPEGLAASMEYSTDLFDRDTMVRMMEQYRFLLEATIANPDGRIANLPLLTERERQQLTLWNQTETPFPDACIHHLFEMQVERSPDAIAVVFEDRKLTYNELNQQANKLANYLQNLGVGPEVLVGICVERSIEMVVGVLGILKAGGGYVPLDRAYPQERLAFMLEHSQASVLLTQKQFMESLPEYSGRIVCLDRDWQAISQCSDRNSVSNITPENLAYLIYTSGSTGKPKGVAMKHGALVNLISWQLEQTPTSKTAKTLQFSPISFDVSFQEIFTTWCGGGTLILIPEEVRTDPEALLFLLTDKEVERLFLPFVALHQLAEVATSFKRFPRSLREVITAGEQLQVTDTIASFFTKLPTCQLHNQYGPSETHVVTAFTLKGLPREWPALPPIGRPIANTQVYILDERLQQVPIGVPGELYIGGVQLARGYLNRPALTAERFITNASIDNPEACLYKTGDLVRYLSDGNIEFLGRIDNQIKLRGYRIELGEIEAILAQHPYVGQAVVVLQKERLVAYWVKAGDISPTMAELQGFLKTQLPAYMVPAAFVELETLPLTPSGKIDRKALPAPDTSRPDLQGTFVAPRNAIEEQLAKIWSEILGIEKVGIEDNFFDLGGHSLLITQLLARVRDAFALDLPLRDLFAVPTVAGLAQQIVRTTQEDAPIVNPDPVDFQSEIILDPSISPVGAFQFNPAPTRILLTGVTGFLGAFLLHDLLQKASADIYCLVRADRAVEAKKRIQNNLETYGLWSDRLGERIIPLVGDLVQPHLGLSAQQFQALAHQIDVIYHNGALVNFTYPYSAIKAANVQSTLEVLKLAGEVKLKPLHFVSTVGVFSSTATSKVEEDDELSDINVLEGGYVQSKWVAEQLLMAARDRGFPINIYRPGRITGHSQTGACNINDFVHRIIQGCIQLGSAPNWNTEVEMVPVDYVSGAIVHLSLQPQSLGKNFHLVNSQTLPWSEFVTWVRSQGYPLERVSYPEWRERLYRVAAGSSDNALYPLLSVFSNPGNSDRTSTGSQFQISDRHTQTALQETDISCPPLGDRLLTTYFSYLVRCGYLPEPQQQPQGVQNPLLIAKAL